MGKILFTERSAGIGSWALYDNSARLCGGEFQTAAPRAPSWFTDILSALAKISVAPADIEAVVVGTGPGSFSGIRANLAAMQGLCMPADKPVFGLSSAASLAFNAASKAKDIGGGKTVAVVGDARRGQIWYAIYAVKDGKITLSEGKPVSHNASDFTLVAASDLRKSIPAGTLVITSEYERLADLICGIDGIENPGVSQFPSADALAALHYANPAAAVKDALPVYLQPAVR